MKQANIMFWVCVVIGALFIYGKYFVANSELQQLTYGIYAMLWIMLGLIVRHFLIVEESLKRIMEENKNGRKIQ